MLLPTLVQRRAADDSEGFNRVLVDSLRYASFGLLLPAAVGGGAAEAVMHVFGAGFGSASTALRWLLLVPLLQTLISIQGTALVASNRPLLTAGVQILRLTMTVATGVVLTLAFGLAGMAIAMAAGVLVPFCVYLVILRLVLRIPLMTRGGYRQIAGLAAAYLSGFGVSDVIQSRLSGALGLAVALLVGSVVYIAVGIGVGGTMSQDRERFRSAIGRMTAVASLPPKDWGSHDRGHRVLWRRF